MAYVFTEKRQAAARANLRKAWEKHCAGGVRRPERPNNLKHGFFSLDLRKSVILLGEDVGEYDAHIERFVKALAPNTDRERRIVQRMAEAAWRLIRSYRARSNAQARKLRMLLDSFIWMAPLRPRDVKTLAILMDGLFNDEPYLIACMRRMREQVAWLFRTLYMERSGHDPGLGELTPRKVRNWEKRLLQDQEQHAAEAETATA